MYRLQQQSDMDFVPCHIRNRQRQEELYEFLIDDKEELLQYSPVLIADNRLTLESIQKLDYLESFLPAPIFSERAKKRIEQIVGEDVVFYPCKISLRGELLQFYLAKIFRKLPILDVENSPFRTLSNGKKFPHILISLPRKIQSSRSQEIATTLHYLLWLLGCKKKCMVCLQIQFH